MPKKRDADGSPHVKKSDSGKKKVKVPGKRKMKYKGTYIDATQRNAIRSVKRLLKSCGPEEAAKVCSGFKKPSQNSKGKNVKDMFKPYPSEVHLRYIVNEGMGETKVSRLAQQALDLLK